MTQQPRCVDRMKLRSLAFDASPNEVAVLDRDGVILDTNGSWETFAEDNGITFHPDMVGENYLAVCDAADGNESATEAARGIRAVIDGEQDSFEFEYPCHSPDERRWFMMRVRRLGDDEDGRVLVVHTNITDRREAELDVAARNEKLELLAGVLSHDLRNPMNVALARAEMLDGDDDHAETIARALERMNDIVDDALVLARGSEVEQAVAVDLQTLARGAWSHVATGDAELVVEPMARLQADDGLLTQLLENLYRNSIENAGDDVTVTVGPLADGSGFFVADDGPGIPADESETVFEPGYTTNAADGGTGLGLAIVERIADAHGWDVRVIDALDGGARFEFSGVTSAD